MAVRKLPSSFYRRSNVLEVAPDLLGKLVITNINGQRTSGRIVETEAYNGVSDRASHAWNGRRTSRTEIMYAAGGLAYVYLCYGIHHLFNVVTSTADIPHAVLIRALEPVDGLPIMLQRRNKYKPDYSITRGPGSLSAALAINTGHTGINLCGNTIWLADDGYCIEKSQLVAAPRIGVDYAGADAMLPWRFYVKDCPYVSKPVKPIQNW